MSPVSVYGGCIQVNGAHQGITLFMTLPSERQPFCMACPGEYQDHGTVPVWCSFTVGGCKSGEDFKFNKESFLSHKARSVSWRAHPQYCNIIQDVTCLQSMEKPCYSFVSKTLRASPVHQATANVTTLKRDSVNTNRAEGCHDVIYLGSLQKCLRNLWGWNYT